MGLKNETSPQLPSSLWQRGEEKGCFFLSNSFKLSIFKLYYHIFKAVAVNDISVRIAHKRSAAEGVTRPDDLMTTCKALFPPGSRQLFLSAFSAQILKADGNALLRVESGQAARMLTVR